MTADSKEVQTSARREFTPLQRRGTRRAISPEVKSRILNLVSSGQRVPDVAQAYGIQPKSIYKWKAELRKEVEVKSEFRRVSVTPLECSQIKSTFTKAKIAISADLSVEIETDDLAGLIKMLRSAV